MWLLQVPHTETVKLQPAWHTLTAALWAQHALTCVLQAKHDTCRLHAVWQMTEGMAQLTTALQPGHGAGPWGLVGNSLTARFLKRNSAIGMPSCKIVWALNIGHSRCRHKVKSDRVAQNVTPEA